MTKYDLSKILKPGAKLTAYKIDYNDPKVRKQLDELYKQQKELLRRRNEYVDLSKIVITI